MQLFDVYSLFDVVPAKAKGCRVWDEKGVEYLDLYGGHAVISIGHSHPKYIQAITDQVNKIAFYSNSVINPLQSVLAKKIGELSGYADYSFFVINSGAEANENCLKLASFATGRKKVVAFRRSFHGRTSGAVAVTDNPKINSPFNLQHEVCWAELNNLASVAQYVEKDDIAAVIIEGVQGCGGIHIPDAQFMKDLLALCHAHGTKLIVDEIQSGYGRTGKFFAHQHYGVKPDLISMAKGIANGFPVGAVLISPEFEAVKGMLGTTFGGNYLGMAAAIAVADVYKEEKLEQNAAQVGQYIIDSLRAMPDNGRIKDIRGLGMMIGIEFDEPVSPIRQKLLYEHHIFTGVAGQNMVRILPPLCLSKAEADEFIKALAEVLACK